MDPALDALDALIETLSADRGRIDLILEKARYVQTLRTAGLDWTNVVERENHPLIVEQLTEIIETLHVSSSRFRRHQARVLRAEGMAMERIAELFGVTRQRVSQLLRAADEPDPSSFGAYRRLPEAAR